MCRREPEQEKEIERAKRVFQPNYADALHTHLHKHTQKHEHTNMYIHKHIYKIHECFCRISLTMGIETARARGESTRKGVRVKGPRVLLACRDDIITSTQAQELRVVWGNINTKKRAEMRGGEGGVG